MTKPRNDVVSIPLQIRCTIPGCAGTAKVSSTVGMGHRLGDLLIEDRSQPMFGRCPLCKSYKMQIVEVPTPPPSAAPKGFTEVPTK